MELVEKIITTGSLARNLFAADMLNVINRNYTDTNVIYSPSSIQCAFALLFMGSEGQTEQELRSGIKLGYAEKIEVGYTYAEFLTKQLKNGEEDGPILKMVNRIYVNDKLQISDNFNSMANQYFGSAAEKLNFQESSKSVKKINHWVEEQTAEKIKFVLSANSISADSSIILVNAIYFKANWAHPFLPELTRETEFYIHAGQKTLVQMMTQDDYFSYAELKELDAQVLELPYANCDLSMMIILPKKIDDLQQLETKLAQIDLNEISQTLELKNVIVYLPKFKIEFAIDLKESMEKLGIQQIFGDQANLSEMLVNGGTQKVSKAKHKAYLDVNEAGSEAAAVTFIKCEPFCRKIEQKIFRADHPFVFAIRNEFGIYFLGHVAQMVFCPCEGADKLKGLLCQK